MPMREKIQSKRRMNRGGSVETSFDPVPIECLADAYADLIDEKSDTLNSWIQEILFPLYYNHGVPITDPELLASLAKKATIFEETKIIDKRVGELRMRLLAQTRNLLDEKDFLRNSMNEMFDVVKKVNAECLENFCTPNDQKLWIHKKIEIGIINGRVIACCVGLSDFILMWLHLCQDEKLQMKIDD